MGRRGVPAPPPPLATAVAEEKWTLRPVLCDIGKHAKMSIFFSGTETVKTIVLEYIENYGTLVVISATFALILDANLLWTCFYVNLLWTCFHVTFWRCPPVPCRVRHCPGITICPGPIGVRILGLFSPKNLFLLFLTLSSEPFPDWPWSLKEKLTKGISAIFYVTKAGNELNL